MTGIEWTEQVWNPTTGCDRVSPGCDHCYALTMAKRLKGMGSAKYQRDGNPLTSGPGFGLTEHPGTLSDPFCWRKPRRVFVNSMSDLFHKDVSGEFIARVFAVMAATPQHTYQILTKRHARMRSFLRDECRCGSGHAPSIHLRSAMDWASTPHSPTYVPGLEPGLYHRIQWPLPNVWLGCTVESQQWADIRVPALLGTPAAVRFLSCEPLLSSVDLSAWMPAGRARWQCGGCRRIYAGEWRAICPGCGREGYWSGSYRGDGRPNGQPISWVIAGGESGAGARPMHPRWPRALKEQCAAAEVPFFFKQWGAHIPKDHTRFWGGIRDVTLTGEWALHERDRTDGAVAMVPSRKDRDGRALDGRTWDEFPAAVVVAP